MAEAVDRDFIRLLDQVNVESWDDGRVFTVPRRRGEIQALFAAECPLYRQIDGSGLFIMYGMGGTAVPVARDSSRLLLSSHIDSRYARHFRHDYAPGLLLGTFDNSICNAIVTSLAVSGALGSGVLIAFTGNEETGGKGAMAVMDFLSEAGIAVDLVVNLDVTAESYGTCAFTMESWHAQEVPLTEKPPRFLSDDEIQHYLEELSSPHQTHFISSNEAMPDDATTYAEFDVNCFSLCLPCAPHPDNQAQKEEEWMHADQGILVRLSDVFAYREQLRTICWKVAQDWRKQR